jgi:poly-beta-1,6-N-acetyl-D-glucosamine synthase
VSTFLWQYQLFFILLVYTYIGYPFFLYLLKLFQKRKVRNQISHVTSEDQIEWPFISILIPAFNEECVIRQKIENCFTLDYPKEKVEIVVASDGSTDETNEMVSAYTENEVQFLQFDDREGKTNVINKVVPTLKGELIVLTDASAMLESDSLKKILVNFFDNQIGAVSGIYCFEQQESSLRERGEYLYWRYETNLKQLESQTGSVIGAHGALLAFRKNLFDPLPKNAINDDFIIPMRIIEKGFRVAYCTDAVAFEEQYSDSFADYRRRSRIFVGNIQQIFILKKLLHPKSGLNMIKLVSHKVLRTLSPLFVLGFFITNFFLNFGIYKLTYWGQIGFLSLAIFGALLQKVLGRSGFFSVIYYLIFGHFSALSGYLKYFLNQQTVTWQRN